MQNTVASFDHPNETYTSIGINVQRETSVKNEELCAVQPAHTRTTGHVECPCMQRLTSLDGFFQSEQLQFQAKVGATAVKIRSSNRNKHSIISRYCYDYFVQGLNAVKILLVLSSNTGRLLTPIFVGMIVEKSGAAASLQRGDIIQIYSTCGEIT